MSESNQNNTIESSEAERNAFLELTKATTILLSDQPQKPVDAVFFFGRSFFDAEKKWIFTIAVDLITQGRATYIFLADSEGERVGETTPRIAYPGKSLYTDRLIGLGLRRDQIIYCPHPIQGEHGFNTTTESESYLKKLDQMGLNSSVALAQPHQIVRAMLGVVRNINKLGLSAKVWSIVPESTDWNKKVKGSQGMELKPRRDHIPDEIDRIFKYQAKGDIASFEELSAYLRNRDV